MKKEEMKLRRKNMEQLVKEIKDTKQVQRLQKGVMTPWKEFGGK